MTGLTWLIVVIVVVIVIAAALMAARKRKSTALREQFGPEYERVVDGADNRRAAESDLQQRKREREELQIRPLPEPTRVRYLGEWQEVQAHFVDQPSAAVDSANALLIRVMTERGYPVADFDARAELISVDHPEVVENYRFAHRVHESNLQQRATTEQLREAFLRYRSLFDELLHAGQDGGQREGDSRQADPASGPETSGGTR